MVAALRVKEPASGTWRARSRIRGLGQLGVLAVAALTTSGCFDGRGGQVAPLGIASSNLEVRRGNLSEGILLTGELQAQEAVVLAAPNVNVWPITVRYLAEDGSAVAKGDVVVEFDNSQLLSNLEDVRTQALEAANLLASRRSRVAAEIAEAVFEVERQRAAVEKAEIAAAVPVEIVSSREYAESQLALRRARLDLAAAEKKLESVRVAGEADIGIQEIALEKARDAAQTVEASLEKLSLRATRDGISVRATNPREARPVRAGDAVWPGLAVARLPDLETLYVKARLFDVDDGEVSAGQRVWATLDAFPETRLAGRVRALSSVANETSPFSARRVFEVSIDLDDVDPERMRPGMSVKVVVEADLNENALLVPRQALDLSGQGPRVMLADGTSRAVSLGACDAQECVVLEGLEDGSQLGRREAWQTSGKL